MNIAVLSVCLSYNVGNMQEIGTQKGFAYVCDDKYPAKSSTYAVCSLLALGPQCPTIHLVILICYRPRAMCGGFLQTKW